MRRYLEFMHLIQQNPMTKLGGLLLGLWSFGIFCLPVEAAELAFWRFDPDQNQLEFTTDQDVQPKVKLIPNPTRLVVDLPGITFNQPTLKRSVGAAITSVRVGKFNDDTTRIVIELAADYTLDPEQVKVRGTTPQRWLVELPVPQRWRNRPSQATQPSPPPARSTSQVVSARSVQSRPQPTSTRSTRSASPAPASPTLAQGSTRIDDLWITPDGLFLKTQGRTPIIQVYRSRNKREITLAIANTSVTPTLNQQRFDPRYHGIQQISIYQQTQSTPTTYITLQVEQRSPDWQASAAKFGGIAFLPQGGASAIRGGRRPNTSISLISVLQPNAVAQSSQLTTIQGVSLRGNQLVIRANRPIQHTARRQGSTYRITLRSAQLTPNFRSPRLRSNSALSQLSVREQTSTGTVTILAKPAAGVRVAGIQRRSNNQVLSLSLRRAGTANIPTNPQFPKSRPSGPQTPLPRVGRRTVVIDPGHGGRDPGAVGIGGLRETDVVLDISLEVARILRQQGANVHLTRQSERTLDLAPRVNFAENRRADVFVSIHANAISLSRPDVNGLETYHAPGARLGSRLARTIHNQMLRTFNMRDRGVKAARFYVIRRTSMPSVLVETGFVTGNEDHRRLRNPAWRKQMAAAIARGILLFLSGRTG